jgi:hypothetical protein
LADVWKALAKVDGFAEGSSIFSDDDADLAYFVNGTQVANPFDGGIELRLTRKVISAHRPRLKEDPRVTLRRSGSDWLGVAIDADLAFVLELAELAAEAHRPPPGVTAKPPPTGADLARRRKFH